MESDWRWNVAAVGMSHSDWVFAARLLENPDYYAVKIEGFNASCFILRPSPAFLPVLVWEGIQLPSTTMPELVEMGIIDPG